MSNTTGSARYDHKTVTIDDWGVKPLKNVSTYPTNNQGDRNITTIYDWDNFKETWYTETVKAGKPIWLRIFTWNYPNHPYIVASADRPIYDVQNRFLGMVAADIHLSPKNMV
ncbi:MAG: hypothetical protein V7K18_12940 [Nostoc sp.]|uniref:hypothetical protein n=1 Tax=Nostoc sp. TaxID=1180 RepID=UPI002FF8F726